MVAVKGKSGIVYVDYDLASALLLSEGQRDNDRRFWRIDASYMRYGEHAARLVLPAQGFWEACSLAERIMEGEGLKARIERAEISILADEGENWER